MKKDFWQTLALKTAFVLNFFTMSPKEAKAQVQEVKIEPVVQIDDNSVQTVTSDNGLVEQKKSLAIPRLFGHYIRQKFEDLPELADSDPTPGICVISVDDYLRDGSIILKRVNPQDMIDKRLDEPMMQVECRYGKHDFSFDEAYHNLSDGVKDYYNQAGPLEQLKFREQCMLTFNDTANYKAHLFESQLNPRRVRLPGSKQIKVVRIGTNQANPTCWALEMAAFACHPDSLVREFAANFVDMNDPENKQYLEEAGRLLYREDGKLLSGSDSVIANRHEATLKLLKVKVGNICENAAGSVLSAKTPYGISTSSGYRYFTPECMRLVSEFDEMHHQTFREAVGQFVRGVYLAQSKNPAFYQAVQNNNCFKIENVGAHLESCNHYGPGAGKGKIVLAAADCKKVARRMARINYLTMNGIEDLREAFPANHEVQRFYDLSLEAVNAKKQKVLEYGENVLHQSIRKNQTQKRDATNIQRVDPAIQRIRYARGGIGSK